MILQKYIGFRTGFTSGVREPLAQSDSSHATL